MAYRPLTKLAHELLRPLLKPGSIAVDATAGNGHDTRFLAQCIAPAGAVYAVDIQEAALLSTAERLTAAKISWSTNRPTTWFPLQENGQESTVKLLHGDHAQLAEMVPEEHRGRVAAAVFNLGYLPGGDKLVRTAAHRTVIAIGAAFHLLKPGGALSVLAYRGHEGGAEEYEVVADCLRGLAGRLQSLDEIAGSDATDSPVLFFSRRHS